jgi:hypothetical protein
MLLFVYKRSNPASATNAVRDVIDLAMFGVAEDGEPGDGLGPGVEALVSFRHGTVDDRSRPLASVRSEH